MKLAERSEKWPSRGPSLGLGLLLPEGEWFDFALQFIEDSSPPASIKGNGAKDALQERGKYSGKLEQEVK
jgi:hypothetical protein